MTLSFLVALIFLIFASVEIRKATIAMREFLKLSEERLKPAIEEAEQTFRNFKKIGSDIGVVTEEIKNVTSAVNDIATNLKAISCIIAGVQEGLSLRASGLKAGVKTAVNVFIDKIKEGRT